MTEIHPTTREPWCDIEAQLRALLDPKHPKRAVWLSAGTPGWRGEPISGHTWVHELRLDAGTLYASEHDCGRLEDEPTEERLADILDYTESKSGICARPALWWPVVQARDQGGRVVWEQVTSWERLGEARLRGLLYGRVVLSTMDEVLARRARLIAQEEDG